jgi:hypothetical protein
MSADLLQGVCIQNEFSSCPTRKVQREGPAEDDSVAKPPRLDCVFVMLNSLEDSALKSSGISLVLNLTLIFLPQTHLHC